MKYTVKIKGAVLLSILMVHIALCSPVVKRDVLGALGFEEDSAIVSQPQLTLDDIDVFGAETIEGGNREKRLLKLKALGLGAGLKAAGAGLKAAGLGVKTIGAIGAKAVGKVAIKTAAKVGAKVAKAAITIGIAKLLLTLVFGKLHQLLGLKSRLLGGLSNTGGGTAGVSASANVGGLGVTAQADVNAGVDADLPEIDPEKVSLQVPDEFISGGFNVVNKGAPVVGRVIQNTAERLSTLVGGIKPILRTSLGFKSFKRETNQPEMDAQTESSSLDESNIPNDEELDEETPSQFRRIDNFSPNRRFYNQQRQY